MALAREKALASEKARPKRTADLTGDDVHFEHVIGAHNGPYRRIGKVANGSKEYYPKGTYILQVYIMKKY